MLVDPYCLLGIASGWMTLSSLIMFCTHRYLPGENLKEAVDKLMQNLQLRHVAEDEFYQTLYDATRAIAHQVLIVGILAPLFAVLFLLILLACCPCLPAAASAACLVQLIALHCTEALSAILTCQQTCSDDSSHQFTDLRCERRHQLIL